jgi:ribose/xylose/arabinose/galactoside ABC-type transport system permease subunit
MLAKTPFGRKVYAVGGNGTAATFSGIPRARVVFTCYLMISAFCVATAGLIQASRSLGAQNTVGQGLELEVLAAVILGGASLLGGSGTIFKTVIGVLILGFIQNGLLLVGLQFYVQFVVTWIIIILAVWLDIAPSAASSGRRSREEDGQWKPETLRTFLKTRRDLGLHRPGAGLLRGRGRIPVSQRQAFMDLDNMLLL